VTNQLVASCKDHIKQLTHNVVEDRDELWDTVAQEVKVSHILKPISLKPVTLEIKQLT